MVTRTIGRVCYALGLVGLLTSLVSVQVSLASPVAAPAETPSECHGIDPYHTTAALRTACNFQANPLLAVTSPADGGHEYHYQVGDVAVSLPFPPKGFDAATASPSERKMYGIPAEPPASESSAHALWEQMIHNYHVVTPPENIYTIGPTYPVTNAGTSENWSGYVDFGKKNSYNATGIIYDEPPSVPTYCWGAAASFWTGVGGDGSTPLDQAGTQLGHGFTVAEHQAWFEIWPQEASMAVNLYASPGYMFEVLLSHETGNEVQGTAYNFHTGESVPLRGVSTETYSGETAEYIAERPSVSSGLTPFADYSQWNVVEAWANGNHTLGPWDFSHEALNAAEDGTLLSETSGLEAPESGRVFHTNWHAYNHESGSSCPNATPTATTESPTGVTQSHATLNGSVNPNGLDTHYYFQYGKTTGYGSYTSTVDAGSGKSSVPTQATVALESSTTYHYRLVAYNADGTSYGSDQSRTTPNPARPAVAPYGESWNGIMWRGTDGNIYDTDAPKGEWESFSPTWSKKGIPSGVAVASDPVIAPSGTSWSGIIWRGTDGNIYETDAPKGEWESFSPTWSKKGIPSGVTPVGDPVVAHYGTSWNGIIWRGSDGNIYDTDAPNGEWETFSPTWSKKGIPSGVTAVSDPVIVPTEKSWSGIVWVGSDGNIYETDAPKGEWETFSATWSKKGIPSGIRPLGDPVVAPPGGGAGGLIWRGSDGNVYETDAPKGEWESYSPTWSKKGIPSGVGLNSDPIIAPSSGNAWSGVIWRGNDGNAYETDGLSGEWESYSPTSSRKGIPSGVTLGGDAVIAPSGTAWSGIMWRGTDGNIYETDEPKGEWESYSPTWSKKGIPSGVTVAEN